MQSRDRLLHLVARTDEPHARTRCRFADRLRIGEVVLVALHERFHELRGDQLRVMPEFLNATGDPVRASTCFHDHRTTTLASSMNIWLRVSFLGNTMRLDADWA